MDQRLIVGVVPLLLCPTRTWHTLNLITLSGSFARLHVLGPRSEVVGVVVELEEAVLAKSW